MFIFPWSQPPVVKAQMEVQQRKQELKFLDQVSKAARRAHRRGLEKKRLARILSVLGETLDGKAAD